MDLYLVTVSPKVAEKGLSAVKMRSVSRKCQTVDRPVERVFGVIFPEVPVLASESGTDCFIARKTGLFGAVWREDRMVCLVKYGKGVKEPESVI
jgi:hypothetical protein